MSSAYYAPLVCKPIVIEQPGRYVTRGGEIVTVHAVSTRNDHGCKGIYSTGQLDGWHRSGRIYAGMLSQNDIVARA